MTKRLPHQPVMLTEVLAVLRPAPGETFVDATLGAGGHAVALSQRVAPSGFLLGVDRDEDALELAASRLETGGGTFHVAQGRFSQLQECLRQVGLPAEGAVDGLLLDLGVSSMQLDRAERGFSFAREGPLDMRMDRGSGQRAADFLRTATRREIEQVLRRFGEEPAARRIAERIDATRQRAPLRHCSELARLVEDVVPGRRGRIHPATRVFQAIRIAVNDELGELERLLPRLDRVLRPGGRVAILSYHSLEDRLVKRWCTQMRRSGLFSVPSDQPLRPSAEEVEANPRARSARLRFAIRVAAGGDSEEK